ncbi:MAG: hypothetical protein AAFX87_15055 [Bacteroidota bacterium]
MNTLKILSISAAAFCSLLCINMAFVSSSSELEEAPITVCKTPKGCVFRTMFGEESSDSAFVFTTPTNVGNAVDNGLKWMAKAQQENGGWGAGSHHRQNVLNPHAVSTDPATTAMVAMALLRTGNTLEQGEYAGQLNKALLYLLEAVESTPKDRVKITTEQHTQIQAKLGQHIDAVLTLQFLTNISDYKLPEALEKRVARAMDVCVSKIQQAQDGNGSLRGAGWAGVLQSSMATNALEAAEVQGADVDGDALKKSKSYQKDNYNYRTGEAKTDAGAGIVLYSVSGSVRASAKEARKVKEKVKKAVEEGKLEENEPVSVEMLQDIGFEEDEALEAYTAYNVYNSSKVKAQDKDVMSGFGNNGGEEFLSYLQTGESLIVNKDETWKDWYDNVSGRLISIQNDDGSWNGHHCITSPVFCTATTLLTLSIHNDIERLVALGSSEEE